LFFELPLDLSVECLRLLVHILRVEDILYATWRETSGPEFTVAFAQPSQNIGGLFGAVRRRADPEGSGLFEREVEAGGLRDWTCLT